MMKSIADFIIMNANGYIKAYQLFLNRISNRNFPKISKNILIYCNV